MDELRVVDILVDNVGHRDRRGVDALARSDLASMLDVQSPGRPSPSTVA